ncbi:MAG TPA: metallophosphoesterase [Gallionella sp.]|nr:metallophosphoesterase [Gallionella sp.]
MLTFMGMAILVYGAMNLYALGKAWRALPRSVPTALALILAGMVLTLSPLLVQLMERQGSPYVTVAAWVSYAWVGYLFLFLCVGLLFDLAHAFAALLRLNWPLSNATAFHAVALLALALLGYGFVEARQIQVEEVTITTPKLASGPITIAQISDLHLGLMLGDDFLDRVTAKLRELKPDIVVATGDIVEGHGGDLSALAARFHAYTPPLGAYAVLGNHEQHAGLENALRFLHDAGFTVLRGESAKTGGIVLAGVDDSMANPNATKAHPPTAPDDFVVLLKHQPVVNSNTRFDLQLSGHVHGGQIFPFVYLTRLVYGVHTGLTELPDGRMLYVSRGAGTWGPPIRLLAPPEITLITIRGSSR